MRRVSIGRISVAAALLLRWPNAFAQDDESWVGITRDERPRQVSRAREADFELYEIRRMIRLLEAREKYGLTGTGLSVAILDTGLRVDHVDFRSRVHAVHNFTVERHGDPDDVKDRNGHGTHVAGIVAANRKNEGIAPGAGIVALKILDVQGNGKMGRLKDALRWVLAHHEEHSISVVNVSLGDGRNLTTDSGQASGAVSRLISQLRSKRIAVVAPAGNGYFELSPSPGELAQQGMAFPAILRDVVSVGSVFDGDVGRRDYDSGALARSTASGRLTPFSQRLHPSIGGASATDIFAPGAPVKSTGTRTRSSSSLDSGTSQAAPVVAGLILLMQELHLHRTGQLPDVGSLEGWLAAGGVSIKDGDDEDDNVTNTGLDFRYVDAPCALWQVFHATSDATSDAAESCLEGADG